MRAVKTVASSAGCVLRHALRRPVKRRGLLVLVGLVLVLAGGCRGYGRYDAQEKMLPELRQAVRLFASDLERARANRDLLRQAAQGDSTLRLVAQEYSRAVSLHEEELARNRETLDRFEDDLPDYRTMHRAFGAVLSEQQATRNRYRSLTKAVRYPSISTRMGAPGGRGDTSRTRRSLPDTLWRARDDAYTEARYYVAPLFYERLQSAGSDITMRQALAERRQRTSQAGRLSSGENQGGALPSGSSITGAPDRAP